MTDLRVGSMGDAPAVEEEPVVAPQEAPQAAESVVDDVEEPSDDEELWPGGPTFGQIKAWKEEYGACYVSSLTPDDHFVWRPINRFEYRRLMKNMEQAVANGTLSRSEANLNNEESMAELCILAPKYNRAEPARALGGVASIIAQQVMEASGFVALEVRQL